MINNNIAVTIAECTACRGKHTFSFAEVSQVIPEYPISACWAYYICPTTKHEVKELVWSKDKDV